MRAYFDSAIIVKLYVQELTSPEAIRHVSGFSPPYALTYWQMLEVRNVIRLKAFRNEITVTQMNLSLAAFAEDIVAGRWKHPRYDVAVIESKTEELSAAHSSVLPDSRHRSRRRCNNYRVR